MDIKENEISNLKNELNSFRNQNIKLNEQLKHLILTEQELSKTNDKIDFQIRTYRRLYEVGKEINETLDVLTISEIVVNFIVYELNFEKAYIFEKNTSNNIHLLTIEGSIPENIKKEYLKRNYSFDIYTEINELVFYNQESKDLNLIKLSKELNLYEFISYTLYLGLSGKAIIIIAGNSIENFQYYESVKSDSNVILGLSNLLSLASSSIQKAISYHELLEEHILLEESEERFHKIFDSLNDAIIVIDFYTDKIVEVNKKMTELFGYTVEEAKKLKLMDITLAESPYTGEKAIDWINKAKDGIPLIVEWVAVHKYNIVFWVEFSIRLAKIGNNKRFILNIRDISDRKKADLEQKKLTSLIENSSELIVLSEPDGKIVYMNPSGYKLTNIKKISREEQNIFDLIDFQKDSDKKNCLDSSDWTGEVKLLNRKDSGVLPVELHSFLVNDESGNLKHKAFIARDITEKIIMEKELIKNKNLESLGILAGGIAHDFNNLMGAMLGNISLAKMMITDNEDVKVLLNDAEIAFEKAKNLTQQLLTFSKGGVPLKKTLDISQIVKESAEFVLRGSNIKCDYNFDENLNHVYADPGQISQVIHNLVINSIQAMPSGGIINIDIKNFSITEDNIPQLLNENYILISITDYGIGITDDNLSKIFDPYFTTKVLGNGLGLSSVYSIIKKHEGFIDVRSKLNSSTTFRIFLPATTKDKDKTFTEQESSIIKGSGSILVMDDEELILKILKKSIEYLGYKITTCVNGEEAIKFYEQSDKDNIPFDLLITDITIPGGMGGKETIEILLKKYPNIKAIVSSGYSNDPIIAHYKDYGFAGAITKPFNINSLSKIIKKVIKK